MTAERDALKYRVIISMNMTLATISIDCYDISVTINRITIASIKGTASVAIFPPRLESYKKRLHFLFHDHQL